METGLVRQEVDIQALISQGLEKGAGIDVMERMFAMAKEADAIRAKRAYYEALAKFQGEIATIIKKEKVNDANGNEVYSYATLDQIVEQIKKPLADNGFSYTFSAPPVEGKISVVCESHHIAGHSESMTLTAGLMTGKYMNEVQGQGSILTYLKRYSFCGIFGIMTGDKDTDAQTKTEKPTEKKPDAPPFPAEESDSHKKFALLFDKVLKEFCKQTEKMDPKTKQKTFEDTCKVIWGEKKYYKPIERFVEPELEKFYAKIMEGK